MFSRTLPLLFTVTLFGLLSLGAVSPLQAQADPVEITRVRFDSIGGRENWTMVTLELRVNNNPLETARSRDYIDNVTMDLYLSYQLQDNTFDFYRSQVRIISLQRGERRNVHFLMPGIIINRDRLRTEPFAFLVEIDIDGNRLPLRDTHVSANLRGNPDAVDRVKAEATSQAARHDGVLVPHYLAPEGLMRAVDPSTVPTYFRTEGR
jgi:hypothetical protein